MSNIRTVVCNADAVLFPVSGRKDKVVITLSGSEGGLEHAEKLARYLQSMGTTRMIFVKRESIYNQFYSDLVTPLDDKIRADGTVIHCCYATKMGEQYEARYRQHFAEPDVIRYDLQHEELLVCYPEQWVSEVENCCGILT